jgi:hypothetical protein
VAYERFKPACFVSELVGAFKGKRYIIIIIIITTAIELSLGGSSPYTNEDKTNKINAHKRNNTKNTVQKIQNTVNTSTHTTKHPHITKPKIL